MNVLLLDNYDSFVYNLKDVLEDLGAKTAVVRNDAVDIKGIERFDPDAIVLVPRPGASLLPAGLRRVRRGADHYLPAGPHPWGSAWDIRGSPTSTAEM